MGEPGGEGGRVKSPAFRDQGEPFSGDVTHIQAFSNIWIEALPESNKLLLKYAFLYCAMFWTFFY